MKEVVRLSRIPPFSVQTTRHAIGRNGSWLCLHKAMHRFFRLCDDCHDDELREERRMRVELLSGRQEARDDCHDDELR